MKPPLSSAQAASRRGRFLSLVAAFLLLAVLWSLAQLTRPSAEAPDAARQAEHAAPMRK